MHNVAQADAYVRQALADARAGRLADAEKAYHVFNDRWLQFEDTVKADSGQAYKDIESNMGQVEYAFMTGKRQDVMAALQSLHRVDDKYTEGGYAQGSSFHQEDITLADFIGMLQQVQEDVKQHRQQEALAGIAQVRQSWLSVEGTVVAQSASVYNDAERDMVTANAMIAAGDLSGANRTLTRMVEYLTPLAGKTGYTVWDAAMIPIREGLEALLVVAALLAFVRKSNQGKGKAWIWGGVSGGLGLSVVLAVIVKLVFSSGAFGQNNFLISGWTGVIAAGMLLYMSYWLHSKSNIAEWNRYIRTKSQSALDTGRMVSLGVLAFLAVFREGTETVLFIIGMVNQISLEHLVVGILIGLAVLAAVAYLMLFAGVKLPIRPFFLVSSLIVFYLCLKFTGLGIHSLQLGGVLPSTSAQLPSISFIGFYPSWESAIPQMALVLFAVAVLVWKQAKAHRRHPAAKTLEG
ncbi:MAG: FTR1 family iron permease [Alicyclobacillus sp.]|nr:FTR1 family iron permease [Alicyclobacillus sp.]